MQRAISMNELNNAISLNGKLKRVKNEVVKSENFVDEEMREEIIRDLKKSEEDIEKGNFVKAEIVFKQLREKYGY